MIADGGLSEVEGDEIYGKFIYLKNNLDGICKNMTLEKNITILIGAFVQVFIHVHNQVCIQ